MKKKMLSAVLAFTLIAGIATPTFASEMETPAKGDGAGTFNYGQMMITLEEMGMTKQEIKNMYNKMHGTNGAAPSVNFEAHDCSSGMASELE